MSESRQISSLSSEGRIRKDLGDLSSLKASIESQGLLQPILIQSDGSLIAGARRLAACKSLGWTEIPVHVRDDLDGAVALLKAERDENIEREDFTVSEKVELGRRLEELERPLAEAREKSGRPSEKFTEGGPKGSTRDKVGAAVGMSGVTYQRAKAVVTAAETGLPEAVAIREEMDRTGKVRPAFNKVNGCKNGPKRPTYSNDTKRGQLVNAKAAERVWKLISGLEGYRLGLQDFDVDRAISGASGEDIKQWDRTLTDSIKSLRELRSRLREEG